MIEIKNQRIADLEIGAKFLYNSISCIRVENGFIEEHTAMPAEDIVAHPHLTAFKNINFQSMFVYHDELYTKNGLDSADAVVAPFRIHKFAPSDRVYKVKKLVAVL